MKRCSHSYFYFTFSLCTLIIRPEKEGCECYCELALTLNRVLFTSVASMNKQPSRRHCLFCFTSMSSCCLSSQSLYCMLHKDTLVKNHFAFSNYNTDLAFSQMQTLYCTSELISLSIFTNRWEI